MRYSVEGIAFDGNDDEWNEYMASITPSDQDEDDLKGYFEQKWIEHREPTRKMRESGIGQIQLSN
jgi:hypothetical protein